MRAVAASSAALFRPRVLRRCASYIEQRACPGYYAASAAATHTDCGARGLFTFTRDAVPESPAPSGTTLRSSVRGFSSFKGKTHEFLDAVREGPVIVFFYKPVCAPCAAIRAKMIDTVTGTLGIRESAASVTAPAEPSGDSSGGERAEEVLLAPPASLLSTSNIEGTNGGSGAPEEAVASPFEQGMSSEYRAVCDSAKRHFAAEFSDVAREVQLLTVNTDEYARLTALHDVRSLPTFMAYYNGRIVGRVDAAREDELLALMRNLVAAREADNAVANEAEPSSTTATVGAPSSSSS